MRKSTIAVVTDFGTRDVYAGVMKGVIARIAPDARVVDLTHEVPPGDLRAGALALWQAATSMPEGTVFLAVVDPGVGTSRRPIAAQFGEFRFVGPDNGLLTFLEYRKALVEAVELSLPGAKQVSHTFHGRDLFAPAAARLARGAKLGALGARISDPLRLSSPVLEVRSPATPGNEQPPVLRGEVLAADGFGNLITSIGLLHFHQEELVLEPWIPGAAAGKLRLPSVGRLLALADGRRLPLARTFAEVPEGASLAYIGSDGLLEIGVNRGSAAEALKVSLGAEVLLV